ncbi:MAG: tetratricopeptide repeat protein, partial [Candidatus Eremiobacterota bacterium]
MCLEVFVIVIFFLILFVPLYFFLSIVYTLLFCSDSPAARKMKVAWNLYWASEFKEAFKSFGEGLRLNFQSITGFFGSITSAVRDFFLSIVQFISSGFIGVSSNINSNTQSLFQGLTRLDPNQKYKEAIKFYDNILEMNPMSSEVWCKKADLLFKMGKYKDALASYDKALKYTSKIEQAWCGKGLVLNEFGKYAEAIEYFDRALKLNPKSATAWNGKGTALNELGRKDEGLMCLIKAREYTPIQATLSAPEARRCPTNTLPPNPLRRRADKPDTSTTATAEEPLKKEVQAKMPVKEVPVKEVPAKEVPVKELPVKEVPAKKEAAQKPSGSVPSLFNITGMAEAKEALGKGAVVNEKNNDGRTPLH